MKAVILIAGNYVREQRWALMLLMAWVVVSALLVSFGGLEAGDALFFIKQQAIYGAAFSAFLAASAIHNDRRSRRILAVLAKGVERRQYLAGLILGVLLVAAVYCAFMGLFGSLLFAALGLSRLQLWYLLALLMTACSVAGATAIFFATFLPPIFTIAATAAALGAGAGLAQVGSTSNVLPVVPLMDAITSYHVQSVMRPQWSMVGWSIAQTIVLWALASWIFSRRDIAVAVE